MKISNQQSAISNLDWLPFLLQTSDALFPTGAYAHSLGFEEIVRLGLVRDEATLADFLRQQLRPALRQHELPYLRFACEAADLHALCALDAEISAWKLAREAREASAQLGGRRLCALRTIGDTPTLSAFATAIGAGRAKGHHLIVCGLQAREAGVPLAAALATYHYQALAAVCAAALKLIRIGQDGCQRVLREAVRESAAVIDGSLTVTRTDAGWWNPFLEIASMRHERAEERLFIS